MLCDNRGESMTKTDLKRTDKKLEKKEKKTSKKKNCGLKIKLEKIWKKITNSIKKMKLSKQKFNTLEMILIMTITVVFGVVIGFTIKKTAVEKDTVATSSELDTVYQKLVKEYYDTVDKDELFEAAVSGMLKYLGDDYTLYMNSEEAESFEERLNGTYYGIGAELVYSNNQTIVYGVFDNTPASKVGLAIGDIISKVNNKDVLGKTPAEISALIKGSNNVTVTLEVIRDSKNVTMKITTEAVDIPTIDGKIIAEDNKKIGYIAISLFAQNTATQFKTKLEELEKTGIDSLIIDVRGNTGGHLSVVADILETLIAKGGNLYQIKSKDNVAITKDKTDEKRTYPIVVLVNGGSASGSEILAGALRETYGADLVGTTTFGKGTVQTTMTLSTGGIMKYTIQTWLTANGNAINKLGITPNIYEELSDAYYENATEENDNQLQKAITILKNK